MIAEIIILTSQSTEGGEQDTVLKRFRKMSLFSYDEYLLSGGQDDKFVDDAFSEDYEEDIDDR